MQKQKPGSSMTKKQAFTTCTLKDLCPEDKQKVAQLVKQVVELGKENQQLKAAASTATAAEEKLRQIQECNKEAVKENCSLKNKLGQAITVLRMYHHKVQGLDAALRALQHSEQQQPAGVSGSKQEQEEKEPDPLPLPAPPATAQSPSAQQHETGSQQAGPDAAASRADSQEAAGGSRQQPSPVSSPAGVPAQAQPAGLAENSTPVPEAGAAVQQQQQCLCSKLLCGGTQGLQALPGGNSLGLGLLLQQLLSWQQLQDSSLFAEQQVCPPHTMLQFDASIGNRGGLVLQELPRETLPHLPPGSQTPPAAAAVTPASSASPATAAGLTLSAQQQQSPQRAALGDAAALPGQPLQQQQQRELSAGGAATAAAAAAATSALAAVRAAAAACAAPSVQHDLSCCSTSSPSQQPAGGGFGASLGSSLHAGWHSAAGSRQEGSSHLAASSAAGPGAYSGPETARGLSAAVEELSVVDMTDAPVRVLVQNEKSASSLHQAHVRVTLAGGLGDGVASPEPPGPAALAAAAAWAGSSSVQQQPPDHPQLWYSDSRQSAGWQQPAEQQQFMPAAAQQHRMESSAVHPSHGAGITQQHTVPAHLVGRAAAPCADRTNVHSHWQPAQQKHIVPHAAAAPGGGGGVLRRPPSPVARPPAAGQQHWTSSDWRQQEEQQVWVQQQQGVGEPVLGTRELLLKFDESLVDILAEVERLEQQQNQARRQQQQQQLHQHQHQQQQLHQRQQQQEQQQFALRGQQQQQEPWASSGAWPPLHGRHGAGALSVPLSSRRAQLELKQVQLQQRIRQLEREDGEHLGGHRRPRTTAAWGLTGASAFDADDVADILSLIE